MTDEAREEAGRKIFQPWRWKPSTAVAEKTCHRNWCNPIKWNAVATKRQQPITVSLRIDKCPPGALVLDHKGRELYTCPNCGFMDHDEQDGDGHWEQGTATATGPRNSFWLLRCSRCNQTSNMQYTTLEDMEQELQRLIDATPMLDWQAAESPRTNDWQRRALEAERRDSINHNRLNLIEALVRKYNTPASNPATHNLASAVLAIIEGRDESE